MAAERDLLIVLYCLFCLVSTDMSVFHGPGTVRWDGNFGCHAGRESSFAHRLSVILVIVSSLNLHLVWRIWMIILLGTEQACWKRWPIRKILWIKENASPRCEVSEVTRHISLSFSFFPAEERNRSKHADQVSPLSKMSSSAFVPLYLKVCSTRPRLDRRAIFL